jgi:flagella basal body P-ring formation protein FlgA
MKKISLVILIVMAFISSFILHINEVVAGERTIRVIGRKSGTVSRSAITVADVAKVYSKEVNDDEKILAIKKISLGSSPRPGETATLTASQVIERMREEGIDLNNIGYAFPRVMTIERAARSITAREVEAAIKAAVTNISADNLEIRSIDYSNKVKVAPGKLSLAARIVPASRAGRYNAQVEAVVKGEEPVRFSVPLVVKEWIDLPVAKRALPRGVLVSEDDVVMARAELSEISSDAARESEHIVGYATRQPISHGEAFQRRKLAIPPMIQNGARITVQYKTSMLEATSQGTALEDGIEGQQIRVRNEGSKRIISGTVIEPGLVRVN